MRENEALKAPLTQPLMALSSEQNEGSDPVISIFPSILRQDEGDSSTTPYTVIITRSGNLEVQSSVDVVFDAGTTNADDFSGLQLPQTRTTIGFRPGVDTVIRNFAVVWGDLEFEADETFTLSLENATNAKIDETANSAQGQILNDDAEPAGSVIALSGYVGIDEGNDGTTDFVFTVTRTGDLQQASAVQVGFEAGDTDAADFVDGLPESLQILFFSPGDESKDVTIKVSGDTEVEASEAFTLSLLEVAGADIDEQASSSVGTIIDDDTPDPVISIVAINPEQDEGSSGGEEIPYYFHVLRTGGLESLNRESSVDVAFNFGDTDADDFNDVPPPTQRVEFVFGVTNKLVAISAFGDLEFEPNEKFTLTLENATGATIDETANSAQATILNDDEDPGPPQPTELSIVAINPEQDEGTGGPTDYYFAVLRSGDTDGFSSVEVAFNAGTTNDDDFVDVPPQTQVVEFASLQTYQLLAIPDYGSDYRVKGDSDFEDDEKFTLSLQNPTNATISETAGLATATILNDDEDPGPPQPAELSIVAINPEQEEGVLGDPTDYYFAVLRSGDTDGVSSVEVAFNAGTTNDDDFLDGLPQTQVVEFIFGQTYQLLAIPDYGSDYRVKGDSDFEDDERFTLSLQNPTNAKISETAGLATATILNDDEDPGPTPTETVISISPASIEQEEGSDGLVTNYDFVITRSGNLEGFSSVEVMYDFGNTDPLDFAFSTPVKTTIEFPIAISSVNYTIPVAADAIFEPDETFTLTLDNPSGATIDDNASSVQGTIVNDDVEITPPVPVLSIADVSQAEGNSGTTVFTVTVTREADDLDITSQVTWTAEPSGDFQVDGGDFAWSQTKSGTLRFGPGHGETQDLTFEVLGDTDVEPDETFTVTLSDPISATLDQAAATVTILNDDEGGPPPSDPVISISPASIEQAEGAGADNVTNYIFDIIRSGDTESLDRQSTVDLVFDFGDTEVNDWQGPNPPPPTQLVTFNPGDTLIQRKYTVLDDPVVEPNETFTLSLDNANGATISATEDSAQGIIVNDDQENLPVISIEAGTPELEEGDSGTTNFQFVITREGDSVSDTSSLVELVFDAGTTDTSDYVGGVLPGPLTIEFEPNGPRGDVQTKPVSVAVVGDIDSEDNEMFSYSLANPDNGTIDDTASSAQATIINDDEGSSGTSVSLSAGTVFQEEGNDGITDYNFTVTRTGDLQQDSSVQVGFEAGDTNAADFVDGLPESSQTLSFGPGDSSQDVTIKVSGDTDFEGDEEFTLSLLEADGAEINEEATSVVATIRNDDQDTSIPDPVISITVDNSEQDEGATFNFNITRSGVAEALALESTVVLVFDYGETEADDFLPNPWISFPPGPLTVPFGPAVTLRNIPIATNPLGEDSEGNETFTVSLENADGATIDDNASSAQATIIDDAGGNSIYISDVQVVEGSGDTPTEAVYNVTLSTPVDATVTVDYETADGTATAGSDYTAVAGTLTFAPGEMEQEIRVPITGDSVAEADETFFVNLSNSLNDVIADGQGEGTIVNDDEEPALGFDGTSGNDIEIFQEGPPADPFNVDIIALDVLAGATVDLLAGDDSVTGLAFTLALFDASAIGIQNRGAFLGNSGNDVLTGTSSILGGLSDQASRGGLGGFSVGISNSDSQALISGGEDNDRMEGIAQGGIAAFGIQNSGVISGDGGSDAISGTSSGGYYNVGGIANYGEISGGVGDDTLTGEAISTQSFNFGFTNTGILNQGGKISGNDGNDILTGNASGGTAGDTAVGISNQPDFGTQEFSVIDMGEGDDTLTGMASGGSQDANVVGIENFLGCDILMGDGNDEVMATGGDRFSAYDLGGSIDLGSGEDTISGFGWQSIDGGTESDTAILGIDLAEASFSTTGVGSNDIDITAGGVTMSFTNVELFGFRDQADLITLEDLQESFV